jgi:epoxyqueuosine reductase
MMNLENEIRSFIKYRAARPSADTRYREPLVGFADAGNPLFDRLKELADPSHIRPSDLLPEARTVVSFFLPFEKKVVESNSQDRLKPSVLWQQAYIDTNALIVDMTEKLAIKIREKGIRVVTVPPTHSFDPITLANRWSHKSMAVIAGLGSFGLHQMVITDSGCAGRFGSFVLDAEISPSPVIKMERCLYLYNGTCQECVQACPIGAIHPDRPLDKHLCWKNLKANSKEFEKNTGVSASVCGKCATGRCAFSPAVQGNALFVS